MAIQLTILMRLCKDFDRTDSGRMRLIRDLCARIFCYEDGSIRYALVSKLNSRFANLITESKDSYRLRTLQGYIYFT